LIGTRGCTERWRKKVFKKLGRTEKLDEKGKQSDWGTLHGSIKIRDNNLVKRG